MLRAGLYARVSTHDQQTLPLQTRAMREYAAKRGWTITVQIKEVGSGAAERELREKLLAAARRREIDVVLVWRLERWGRSLVDLVTTLKELSALSVAFVSLTEALDLTTPTGRAMAGLLSVFAEFEHEILRERIRAGIAEARLKGKHLGNHARAAGRRRSESADHCFSLVSMWRMMSISACCVLSTSDVKSNRIGSCPAPGVSKSCFTIKRAPV